VSHTTSDTLLASQPDAPPTPACPCPQNVNDTSKVDHLSDKVEDSYLTPAPTPTPGTLTLPPTSSSILFTVAAALLKLPLSQSPHRSSSRLTTRIKLPSCRPKSPSHGTGHAAAAAAALLKLPSYVTKYVIDTHHLITLAPVKKG
jgi:hypothetical protein